MQVSVESVSALERRLRIDVPEEHIAGEVANRLQSMTQKVRIKGFRPGKVPLKIVQSRYADEVRREVIGEVVKSSLSDAIVQENLQLAVAPELEGIDPEHTGGLTFTAKIEVLPDITLAPVEALTIDKPYATIGDTDIDKMISSMRRQQRKPEPVDRPAEDGDSVVIDFVGRVDGEVFDGGSANDFVLELGSRRFVEGFEAGLIGMRAGDHRVLNLRFPDEYMQPHLAGKAAEFEVDVKSVNALIEPELDNEFFATMGVASGGIDAFRAEIRKSMERESAQETANRIKASVMDKLYETNPIELPPSLVTREAERLQANFRSARRQDEGGELSPDDRARCQSEAEKRVALRLIVTELVKTHQLSVEPSRVRAIIENIASAYEDSSAVISWYYADKQRLAEVEGIALEERVVDWIMARAKVNEIELAFDALINNRQT